MVFRIVGKMANTVIDMFLGLSNPDKEKNMSNRLTANFTRSEMECKCGCGLMNISQSFMDRLQRLRTEYGKPMTVTSGTRCAKHNATVSTNPQSDHVLGAGVDIACVNARDRFRLLELGFKHGFDRMGVRRDFVHFGLNVGVNPEDVFWLY